MVATSRLIQMGGAPDPTTVVVINGQTYNFIFELSGTLPPSNSSVPDQFEAVPPAAGAVTYLITVIGYPSPGDETRLFFLPEEDPTEAEMNDFGTGAIRLQGVNSTDPPPPVCLAAGSQVMTISGYCPVEDIRPGDLVQTLDGGHKQVVWVSGSVHEWPGSDATCKPVLIAAGALDGNLPVSDLQVSPQHHILFEGALCQELFGIEQVLAPAKGLVELPGVRIMEGKRAVDYVHIMLESHEIIMAHGVATESFYPGPNAVRMLTPAQRASLYGVVPALKTDPENGYGPTARKKITRREAEKLVAAILADRKAKAIAAE